MIYVRTLRACKDIAGIALKSGVHTDRNRNGPVVINGLFYGLRGWNTILAAYECPGINLVRMGVGAVARYVRCHVGEICFGYRSGLGFAGRFLPLMVIVGPPPAIAAPAICVTGDEILL